MTLVILGKVGHYTGIYSMPPTKGKLGIKKVPHNLEEK